MADRTIKISYSGGYNTVLDTILRNVFETSLHLEKTEQFLDSRTGDRIMSFRVKQSFLDDVSSGDH